ncbi:MAG: nuclear transport factor 2 family protein [Chloroflexota bacterium]
MDATTAAQDFSPSTQDVQEIVRTGVDYIESWYTGDAERMKGCLHPELAKRFVMKDPDSGATLLRTTTAQRMYELTGQGEGTNLPEASKTHEVTILDAFRNIACVKVVSHDYVDYLDIARFDERWLIVNALWDMRHPDPT